jgi:uncharacterized protein (TIGR02271 family)
MTDYSTSGSTGSGSSSGFGSRAITAMFDSRDAADTAVRKLLENGFSQSDVRLVPGYEKDRDLGGSGHADQGGFWSSLSDFFFPDEDRHTYAEGLSRGNFLVSVNTTDANHDRALDILDDEGTIDLDEREDQWRSQGWSGYAGAPTGTSSSSAAGLGAGSDLTRSSVGGSGMTGMNDGSRLGGPTEDLAGGSLGGARDRMDTSSTGTAGITGDGLGLTRGAGANAAGSDRGTLGGLEAGFVGGDRSGQSSSTAGAGLSGGGRSFGERGDDIARRSDADEVIPVAEESLRVGKREVEGGRVRVRSYVVERPVEEQVMLRRERVDLQRRSVDRAVGSGEDPFRERTVELQERREEPVVSKEARIREEVALRKDVQNDQRTVSDTVRRTEVEVEDERTGERLDKRRSS